MLLSPSTPREQSDAMRSLVKLGAKSVPALVEHLADRKNKIVIKIELGGFFRIGHDEGEKAEEKLEKGKGEVPFRNPNW